MKKLFVVGSLLFASLISKAQYGYNDPTYGYNNGSAYGGKSQSGYNYNDSYGSDRYFYDDNFDWRWDVRVRISQGLSNGRLTSSEANWLYNQLQGIEQKEYAYQSDGYFSGQEQNEIWQDVTWLNQQLGLQLNDMDRQWYGYSLPGVSLRGYLPFYSGGLYDFYRFDKRGYGSLRMGYMPRNYYPQYNYYLRNHYNYRHSYPYSYGYRRNDFGGNNHGNMNRRYDGHENRGNERGRGMQYGDRSNGHSYESRGGYNQGNGRGGYGQSAAQGGSFEGGRGNFGGGSATPQGGGFGGNGENLGSGSTTQPQGGSFGGSRGSYGGGSVTPSPSLGGGFGGGSMTPASPQRGGFGGNRDNSGGGSSSQSAPQSGSFGGGRGSFGGGSPSTSQGNNGGSFQNNTAGRNDGGNATSRGGGGFSRGEGGFGRGR